MSIRACSAISPAGPADVGELTRALNLDSGLQGLSGVGNDMRTVEAAAAGGNERAQLALDVFVHRLSKAIAGLVVGLARLDALVFTGGIGENSAVVRSLVLSRLGFLGLAEDAHGQRRPWPGNRRAHQRGSGPARSWRSSCRRTRNS